MIFRVIFVKYPNLIPPWVCKTPICVTLYDEGLTEEGSPKVAFVANPNIFPSETLYPSENLFGDYLYCNFQDGAKTILNEQKKIVEISGAALFSGDFCPLVPIISGGEVEIFGIKRQILRGIKARNPDGTVNYIKLELI